jgi:hypothetical protein
MARSDLRPIFEAVNLPVVIGHWTADEKPVWPFLEYHRDGENDFVADNSNYRKIDSWAVSIYALVEQMADFYDHCEELEDALTDAHIVYDRSMDVFTGEGTVYAEYTFDLPR